MVIGKGCVLHPGVKIYHQCVLGNDVIIHAGTVLGGDGFGFAPQPDGSLKKSTADWKCGSRGPS